MEYHVLAIGDVVGENGLAHLERHLRPLQKMKNIAFTVVNGENASGVGLTPEQARRIYDAGADAVTLGNHTFGKMQIAKFLDDVPYLLRPANFTGRAPGHGWEIFDRGGVTFRVVNLIGRCSLNFNAENPFTTMDKILGREKATFTLVDFHAEATSEKLAMGYYLDGRVSALWGTHTHVPTADERVYPKGTGYLTDLGMTGAVESVLGIRPEQSVESFLGGLPGRYQTPDGPCKMQGAIFTLDSATGLCTAVERVDIR
ncbi:TIGR00282 family metallophosphoesterase [Dysosmobacter sp. HCP28S3_G4]|uniref:TIGR00282 family metallophosphoesterase n=1 Tax=Dysosmobacter sp. HCP28S3_G4 TaxID=3438938 RepID=UPI003F8937AF